MNFYCPCHEELGRSEKENELLSLAIRLTFDTKGDGGVLCAVVMITSILFLYVVMFSTNFP